jgi:L-aminopeptidase/D-esterase-like protein
VVDRVNAVVLTGGSAYGLAAADGVMAGLEASGRGFQVGPDPLHVVPIVPAAVIFDLGRGGVFRHRPGAEFGALALAAAAANDPATGCVGAGTGATCGPLKGGFGYAETALPDGLRVAAAVVLNAAGSPVDSLTGRLYADREHRLSAPSDPERQRLSDPGGSADPPFATTIGVLLTNAVLTKAQANKVAAVGHDGMARAINPIHTMMDGDTVFCLASGTIAGPTDFATALGWFNRLLAGAADVFTDACLNAMLSATSRGQWPAYRALAPSTVAEGDR